MARMALLLLAILILVGAQPVPAALAAETSISVNVSSGAPSNQSGIGSRSPVDTLISHESDLPGFTRSSRQRACRVYFSEHGNAPTRFAVGGSWIEFRPVGATASMGRFTANQARFERIWPATDVVYSVEPGLLKEDVVLSSPEAGSVFTFRVTLNDAYPQLKEDGGVSFINSAGQEVFEIPAPFAYDSTPGSPQVGYVEAVLRGDQEGLLLDLVVDPAWLNDPARVFPVTVDPTVAVSGSGSTGQTVYFNVSAPQTITWSCNVYGYTYSRLESDTYYTGYFAIYDPSGAQVLLKSQTGNGSMWYSGTVTASSSQVGNWRVKVWGTHSYAGGKGTVAYYSQVPSGSPRTASVSGAGSTGNTVYFNVNVPQELIWNCNVYGYTKAGLEVDTYYTGYFAIYDPSGAQVALKSKAGSGSELYCGAVTASASQLGNWKVKVWGDYSSAGGSSSVTYYVNQPPSSSPSSPTGGTDVTTLRPTLTWTYTDPESKPQAKFRVQVSSDPNFGTLFKDTGWVTSSGQSWTIDSDLFDHTTYYWRVMVQDSDGIQQTGWSTSASFKTKVVPLPLYTFTYNATGDRLTQTKSDQTHTYSYSDAGLLQSVTYGTTTEHYYYDANGNQTKRTITTNGILSETWEYEYDVLNRLTAVYLTKVGGARNWVAKYVYDPDGLRVRTVMNATPTSPARTTVHIYDGLNVVYEEVFEGVSDPTALLVGLTPSLKVAYVCGGNTRIAKVETDASGTRREYYYLNDHLGSTRAVTDSAGNIVVRMSYEPFGMLKDSSGSVASEAYRYTGKPYDDPIGLYYYGARFYDPSIGRFITQDPAQDGVNWYVYCSNNPIAYIDPTGMWGKNVHYDHTYASVRSWLGPALAHMVAEWCDRVDWIPTLDPVSDNLVGTGIHFDRDFGPNDSRDAIAKDWVRWAATSLAQGKWQDAYRRLGMSFHPVQDKSAHPSPMDSHLGASEYDDPYWAGPKIGYVGTTSENPRFRAMEQATEKNSRAFWDAFVKACKELQIEDPWLRVKETFQ